MTILAVDVGTTAIKMGVFKKNGDALQLMNQFSCEYPIRIYNDGLFADIEPKKWKQAFISGCREMADDMSDVDVISLSGTTPGLTAMDADGNALYPAILMLDQRSRLQAQQIIRTIGIQTLLDQTGNMPVTGGCSLSGILWFKENLSDVYQKTVVFGHSNTYMACWLTGNFAIDPSSASLTALYNTVVNDFKWNEEIASAFGLSCERLPQIIRSYESVGCVKEIQAKKFGLTKMPEVVIGGNDAVLAAYSVGIEKPGDILNVNGTCEITLVCLPRCISSKHYNVRNHVIPNRWLTLYVMNAGGIALEWFRTIYCSEMNPDEFYKQFITEALKKWVDHERGVRYVPYLMGSRYSHKELTAEFRGITQKTTRDEFLVAMIRGLCEYQREHLKDISIEVPLGKKIHITGGAASNELIRAKKRWMRDCEYRYDEQSSMKGAAMLGCLYLNKKN